MNSGKERVFVYGALRRGGADHPLLLGADFLGKGWVRGMLYAGPQRPDIDPAQEGRVEGEVYVIDGDHLETLDLHDAATANGAGRNHLRRRIEVRMSGAGQESIEAWIWCGEGSSRTGRVVASGDWFKVEPEVSRAPWFTLAAMLPIFPYPYVIAVVAASQGSWTGMASQVALLMAPLYMLVAIAAAHRRSEGARPLREVLTTLALLGLILALPGAIQGLVGALQAMLERLAAP